MWLCEVLHHLGEELWPLLLSFLHSPHPPPHPQLTADQSWPSGWGGPSLLGVAEALEATTAGEGLLLSEGATAHTEVSFVKQHAACFSCLYHLPSRWGCRRWSPGSVNWFLMQLLMRKETEQEPVPFLPSYPSSSLLHLQYLQSSSRVPGGLAPRGWGCWQTSKGDRQENKSGCWSVMGSMGDLWGDSAHRVVLPQ